MDPHFKQRIRNISHTGPADVHISGRQSPHTAQTLPSLQPQHATMPHPMYGYAPSGTNSSRSLGLSGMPLSSTNLPHLAPQPASIDMQHQITYGDQSFSSPAAMMSSTTGALPDPHQLASAHQSRLPVPLRPMPSGGLSQDPSETLSSMFGPSQMMPLEMSNQDSHPTHVVGSQGRRGILPSAPGRAAAVTGGGNPTKNITPFKDGDGKFPCPHCTKTYLHAKHLKRHLLRHTGDRPYMCFLCKDTFSRSDILKRHFQKCSLRRGNPTGASHLAHSQAHVKQSRSGPQPDSTLDVESRDFMGSMNAANGIDESALSHDLRSAAGRGRAARPVPNPESNESLLDERSTVRGDERNSLTGMGPSGSSQSSLHEAHDGQVGMSMSSGFDSHTGGSTHGQESSRYSQQFDFGSHDPVSGTPLNENLRELDADLDYYNGVQTGSSSELDWSQMLPPNSHDHLVNPVFPSGGAQQQAGIKIEPSLNGASFNSSIDTAQNGVFSSLYHNPPTTLGGEGIGSVVSDYPNWHLDLDQIDPLQSKTHRLVEFCFPPGIDVKMDEQPPLEDLKACLTAANVKSFIELFTNFQGHWPIIHVPTFKFTEAYDGLVLAMFCVGAVYSDKLGVSQVRGLMERVKAAIERSSQLLQVVKDQDDAGAMDSNNSGPPESPTHVEELQALFLIQMLFTWHGTSSQQEYVRIAFPNTVGMARKARLLEPCGPESPSYSMLHQQDLVAGQQDFSDWDWRAWVEQEKRLRMMYNVYLLDMALVIYFNVPPIIDSFEVRIPLPADDAAWDAKSSTTCAEALGLHGPEIQKRMNISGSRRLRQPEMHLALKALLQPNGGMQIGTSNVYAKFILVHALHVQIWRAQRHLVQAGNTPDGDDFNLASSAPDTPGLQDDWISRSFDERNNISGEPRSIGLRNSADNIISSSPNGQQLLNATKDALGRWKKVWDEDWAVQYPIAGSSLRRFGFCRDGVHFYWLAHLLLQRSRPVDCFTPPDIRLRHILRLLKQVQQWVAQDTASRGEDIGSVGDIDDMYGMEDLTLDMKLLFKPINEGLDSPVSGVQTDVNGPLG